MLLQILHFLISLQCIIHFGTGSEILPVPKDGEMPAPFITPLSNPFASVPPTGSLPQQNNLPTSERGQTWAIPAISTDFQFRCKPWPTPVQDFVTKFVQNVNADSSLKSAFALDGLDADRTAEIYRDTINKAHKNAGAAPDAVDFSSQLVHQTMKDNFPEIAADTDRHARKLANLLGKYLYLRGRLTPESVDNYLQQLLTEYRKSIQKYAASNPTGQLSPENRIPALHEGEVDFLTSHGLYTADTVWVLPALFVDE